MGIGKLIESLKKDRTKKSVQELIYEENLRFKKVNKEVVLKELHNLKTAIREEEWLDTYHTFLEFYQSMVNFRERAEGVFHPSTLSQDCDRRLWYDINNEPKSDSTEKPYTGRIQAIFDLGTFIHVYIQTYLMRIGVLECAEKPVIDKKWFIDGHTDGIVKAGWLGLKKRAILEIKSIGLNGAKKLQYGPLEAHKNQAGLYASVLGIDTVYFVYYIKDNSEIVEKVWTIEEDRLKIQYDIMKTIIEAKEAKSLRKICPKITCEAAKSCAWRTTCFSI